MPSQIENTSNQIVLRSGHRFYENKINKLETMNAALIGMKCEIAALD